jgi:ABC-type amino acid transport substrate-binding protein
MYLFRRGVLVLLFAVSAHGSVRADDAKPDTAAALQAALKFCLNENLPPFSVRHGRTGFDIALAEAIGQGLERPIAIRWFESEVDGDKSPTLEANALLSDGLCDLVGNFPLTEDTLEPPHVPTSRLPDYDGANPADRRRRVTLGTLIPSQPVRYAALSVVLGPGAKTKSIQNLGDLAGLKIGSDSGTFGDIVLMQFDKGRLVNDIAHVVPGRGQLFDGLERGEFDAALIDLGRFDAYRASHADTKLQASGFHYRIGFNMGFVALSTQAQLIGDLDRVLANLQASGKLEALAQQAGVTYLPPNEPAVTPHIFMKDLAD